MYQDHYHNAFEGDRFKRWVEFFYLHSYPPILVLDNCPSHIISLR